MNRLARFAWIVVAWNLAVIGWGAYVRATGSGAGCGQHWPLCNGEIVPRAPAIATIIELTHRLTSGLALLALLALVVAVWRSRPAGHPARRAAGWSMLFMLTEAGVGAGLVLFELVADNASLARALFMAVHLANTFLLLGAMTLTARWLEDGPVGMSLERRGGRAAIVGLLALGVLVVSVSGAVAALGDTLFPATSLAHAPAAGSVAHVARAAPPAGDSPDAGRHRRAGADRHRAAPADRWRGDAAGRRVGPGSGAGGAGGAARRPAGGARRPQRGAARAGVAAARAPAGRRPAVDCGGAARRRRPGGPGARPPTLVSAVGPYIAGTGTSSIRR